MDCMNEPRPVFPLRLRDASLRDLVREVADREHISQNELIERAIKNEVVARGALLAADLAASAERLAKLTADQRERLIVASIEDFGRGEGLPEPMQARAFHVAASPASAESARASAPDELGVIAAFDAGRR